MMPTRAATENKKWWSTTLFEREEKSPSKYSNIDKYKECFVRGTRFFLGEASARLFRIAVGEQSSLGRHNKSARKFKPKYFQMYYNFPLFFS